MLPTALLNRMDLAKPLRSQQPRLIGAHGDSKHTEPCLYWRCELYVRLSIIVKTKLGRFFPDNRSISWAKLSAKMDAILLYQFYFS
jgi:hypothetical protein